MLIRRPDDIAPSDIAPRSLFDRRREFLRLSAGTALAGMFPAAQAKLGSGRASIHSSTETPTPLKHVVGYNNYYEFGTDKEDPARTAHAQQTQDADVQWLRRPGQPALHRHGFEEKLLNDLSPTPFSRKRGDHGSLCSQAPGEATLGRPGGKP
ncbi:MAG: hypothetical protein Q8O52_00580 [Sulfuritalea sp.]|nr:hypothetical protein [Sulfuritalea sp.]